jgi:hypothetical protein
LAGRIGATLAASPAFSQAKALCSIGAISPCQA